MLPKNIDNLLAIYRDSTAQPMGLNKSSSMNQKYALAPTCLEKLSLGQNIS